MRVRRLVLAAVGLGVAVLACTSATSTRPVEADAGSGEVDGSPVEASADVPDVVDAGPTCNLPGIYGSKACNACIAERCCSLVEACEADPACKPLQACVLDCTTKPDGGGCYDDCLAKHPDGVAKYTPIDTCWFATPPGGCLIECT